MSEPTTTVRQFIANAYQLISANSPDTTLPGRTQAQGLMVMNTLLNQYSANGLQITVEKTVDFSLPIGQEYVTFGPSDYTPTPDITTEGRLALLFNAWLTLDGVTYPLQTVDRHDFNESYKYDPLQGLPLYTIVYPDTNITSVRIFPAPSQVFDIQFYGKYQLYAFTLNDDLSTLPTYYQMFFTYAVAKDLAFFTGRATAWTKPLEDRYRELLQDVIAVTPMDLSIKTPADNYLTAFWRVISGI